MESFERRAHAETPRRGGAGFARRCAARRITTTVCGLKARLIGAFDGADVFFVQILYQSLALYCRIGFYSVGFDLPGLAPLFKLNLRMALDLKHQTDR